MACTSSRPVCQLCAMAAVLLALASSTGRPYAAFYHTSGQHRGSSLLPAAKGLCKTPRLTRCALAPAIAAPLASSLAQRFLGLCGAMLGVSGLGLGALLSLILAGQYGPILKHRKRLPPVDLGLPVLGQSNNILKHGWSGGGRSWLRHLQAKHGPAFVFNLLFVNRVAVYYTVYEKYMQELERAGKLRPLFSKSMQSLLGQKSVLTLPGGKGGALHARIRQKIGPALTQQQLCLMAPQVEAMCRLVLEDMVEETIRDGRTTLLPKIDRLTQDVAAASLLGGFADPDLPHLARIRSLMEDIVAGLFNIPVERVFGQETLLGKAMRAKVEACQLIDELSELARKGEGSRPGQRDVLSQLARESAEGQALSAEEIHDSVVTMAFAGKVTAAAALLVAVVELARRPDWIQRLASEAPHFEEGVERARPALQFIREAMRIKPPAAAFYRGSDEWIDLGELGAVPPGMPVAVCMDHPRAGLAEGMSEDFEPERWTEEHARQYFIFFGGATPHTCPGRGLALLEMQIFLGLLCRDYSFEVLSEETFVDRAITQVKYKNGLPMKVFRKEL
ncbi:unnamed protein product [Polarella glacialis]|uniref:Cytochrome P450 n=1 Tax=Polarella glacialis TaxID=89957 RepID=A0A813K665_POLGL|nr:unnamed protein product [Polarella glacialis]